MGRHGDLSEPARRAFSLCAHVGAGIEEGAGVSIQLRRGTAWKRDGLSVFRRGRQNLRWCRSGSRATCKCPIRLWWQTEWSMPFRPESRPSKTRPARRRFNRRSGGRRSACNPHDPNAAGLNQTDAAAAALEAAKFRATPVSNLVLYAFDAETGKQLYSSESTIKNWVHFSEPVVALGKVFVVTWDAHVYAFRTETQWRVVRCTEWELEYKRSGSRKRNRSSACIVCKGERAGDPPCSLCAIAPAATGITPAMSFRPSPKWPTYFGSSPTAPTRWPPELWPIKHARRVAPAGGNVGLHPSNAADGHRHEAYKRAPKQWRESFVG